MSEAARPSVILLDIECTTTPIAFVHEELFGYVRLHLDAWLAEHAGTESFASIERAFAAEHAADPDGRKALFAWRSDTLEDQRESIATYAWFLMERDRKSPALKDLQGLIWKIGYDRGDLRGVVYDDVAAAFEGWRAAGRRVAIYSSGSELAQRLLFQSSNAGDLSSFIAAYFDTRVGAKTESESYRRIARELGVEPADVLFVSDVAAELAAARDAGCDVRLIVRPGAKALADSASFMTINSLTALGTSDTGKA